ncbi:GNAT family N-acetyltransferase [Aliikangiella coralliicola]|uniref:GNAT family N-acetyltransferase n=1 Tax=Aliikangiella coralliicola TaxID=2592383 RepID=A0A545U8Z8_9GAMM|nr:GNAT family N-acetyltransferase [Aliikangiella coralliicola]TQV85938.1 GNAT family N-acetyltransferase [Aliikangiella coralliicola]
MKFELVVVEKHALKDSHRTLFAEMLKMQGKVQGDLRKKADRCKCICIATTNGKSVAIGAIKKKTDSDFAEHKANIPELSKEFQWELGYLFTDPEFQGHKIASSITQSLIRYFGNDNLMASTEITENPGMVKILENNAFKLHGKPWKVIYTGIFWGYFLK